MAKNKICGIYCIENLINNKKYIGQSIDINQRWRTHKSELNNNKHYNIQLQRAWNKYGNKNFNFYIIENCDYMCIDEREKFYIAKYNTYKNGYNRDLGGSKDKDVSPDFGKKISQARLNKTADEKYEIMKANIKAHEFESIPVYQIDLNGNIVKLWSSARRAGKELNIIQSVIWTCLNKTRKTYKGYIWLYESEIEEFNLNDYINQNTQAKKIYQFNFDGELIKEWDSSNETTKYGFDPSAVIKCCKEKCLFHKGFIWSYSRHVKSEIIDKIKEKQSIKIFNINLDYLFSTYDQKEASKLTGVSVASISLCLNGKINKTKGYIFKYAS
jgi:hypothetical protein